MVLTEGKLIKLVVSGRPLMTSMPYGPVGVSAYVS
jgi:hypothetical protein